MSVRAVAAVTMLALALTGCSAKAVPSSGQQIRRIAVLPLAYRDDHETRKCDLCPNDMVLAATSRDDAMLVTAFFYEHFTRHPRFSVIPYAEIETARGADMRSTLAGLGEWSRTDAVLVGALLELRRPGSDGGAGPWPGAATCAALLDRDSGRTLWSSFLDTDEQAGSAVAGRWQGIVEGKDPMPARAVDIARQLVGRMVDDLAGRVD